MTANIIMSVMINAKVRNNFRIRTAKISVTRIALTNIEVMIKIIPERFSKINAETNWLLKMRKQVIKKSK